MAYFRDAGVYLLAEEGDEEAEDCTCDEEDEEDLVSGFLRGVPRLPRQRHDRCLLSCRDFLERRKEIFRTICAN